MLDDTAHQNLLASLDVAINKCIDAFNMASEGEEHELAEGARRCVAELKAFREVVRARPTRPARWQNARSHRGDSRPR